MVTNQYIELSADIEISQAAALEAAITFLKLRYGTPEESKFVYFYPEILRTERQRFLFAMEFGRFLNDFQAGRTAIPQPAKEIFFSDKAMVN